MMVGICLPMRMVWARKRATIGNIVIDSERCTPELDQVRVFLVGSFVMRRPWTPSIVPAGADQNVYIVVDDFGRKGRAYRETDVETADLETTITDLMAGEFSNPIRVVAFNTAER
jgi:hypothetical protein